MSARVHVFVRRSIPDGGLSFRVCYRGGFQALDDFDEATPRQERHREVASIQDDLDFAVPENAKDKTWGLPRQQPPQR